MENNMRMLIGVVLIFLGLINIFGGNYGGFIYLLIGLFFLWQGWDSNGEKTKKYFEAYLNIKKKKKKRK